MHQTPNLWEIKAAALSQHISEQVSAVKFSASEELLWAGTERGFAYGSIVPEFERYCSFKAHRQRILDIIPLPPSIGYGALSLSAEAVHHHSTGGTSHFKHCSEETTLAACLLDTQSPQTVFLGNGNGEIKTLNLQTGQLKETFGTVAGGIELMRSPAPRGLIAVAGSAGDVAFVDQKSSFKVEQSIKAHTSGIVAMDVSGSLLATAGLSTHRGHLVHDTIVKVYDLRSTARVMTSIPFSLGPSLLRFHPRFSNTLLIAASSGQFLMEHVQAASLAQLMQVETEGDVLTSVDFSSSGECLAFGGSGGFIHLWGFSSEPRVNLRSTALQIPSIKPQPATTMDENQPFSIAAQPILTEENLLSVWDLSLMGPEGLPPRVIDPVLFKDIKQVDFVTYIPNPHYRRDAPQGEASRKVAKLRNKRMQPKLNEDVGWDAAYVEDTNTSTLPEIYHKVHITLDVDRRYEEFNFSRYNKTRFAGLENGIANCYANALIQVLYFIPRLRAYFLGSIPSASLEFSLLDELGLLFRMLASESGHACQATNFLRALRQSREATGLGLLEGHTQQGTAGADIEVEANKDQSLARRVQRLQRFLLDKLHHEALQRQKAESQWQGLAADADGLGMAHSSGSTSAAMTNAGVEDTIIDEAELRSVPGETAGRTTSIDQVFGIKMRQRMQGLQGTKPTVDKEMRCFQVDLQYPKRAKSAASSNQAQKLDQAQEPKPSFGKVLEASFRAEGETRAWINDELQYQYVRQTRHALEFPQVLALGTGLQDQANLHWWQDKQQVREVSGEADNTVYRPWPPLALSLELVDGSTEVREAESIDALPSPSQKSEAWAQYELTAVIALIQEDLEGMGGQQKGKSQKPEGHLVAHIQVPPSYLDKEVGTLPTPRVKPPSPGHFASQQFRPSSQFVPGPAVQEHPFEGLPEDPFGDKPLNVSAELAIEKEGAAAEHGLPDDPFGDAVEFQIDAAVGGFENGTEIQPAADPDVIPFPASMPQQAAQPVLQDGQIQAGTKDEEPQSGGDGVGTSDSQIPQHFANLKVTAERSDSFTRGATAKPNAEPVWLLINDFSISQTPKNEALQLFGGHKLPCLLYYTQGSAIQGDTRQDFKVMPREVLASKGPQSFFALCRQPPLQASLVGLHRLGKPTFWPLNAEEGPRPGLILGLDAEFVAFSPPRKALRGGVEIETMPSRLGLARVSVIRGEDPEAGKACMDDYIRATEPVFDYLTQYSGLKSGDLDPAMSQHHLTTLKATYLKLRYLADLGCVFVGHGLKKDFRMINILVPPHQVVDTVDLFYLKRQRKISLKFLAAYLLRKDIQQVTHDSIEDARTALNLYKLYRTLQQEGRVREVLEGMYSWGKQYGWNPSTLKEHSLLE